MSSSKRDDALFVRESTTVEELLEYVRNRIEEPVRFDGNTVWNLSSYEFDEEAFSSKREDEFVVPFEVTGTWGVMFSLLPERVREAELLVYQDSQDEYIAYKNFYDDLPALQRREFRSSMSKIVDDSFSPREVTDV